MGKSQNKDRNAQIRKQFYSIIFAGNVDKSIKYLEKIDENIIKNRKCLDAIKEYINRKRHMIYCYALRKITHLQNSSSLVEKAKDILVAFRCKRKGMSWVTKGLTGMTGILFLSANKETNWYNNNNIQLAFNELSEKLTSRVEKLNENIKCA